MTIATYATLCSATEKALAMVFVAHVGSTDITRYLLLMKFIGNAFLSLRLPIYVVLSLSVVFIADDGFTYIYLLYYQYSIAELCIGNHGYVLR